MNYKDLFEKTIQLLSSPAKAWTEIEGEQKSDKVMSEFVYPMIGFADFPSSWEYLSAIRQVCLLFR